MPVFPVHPFPLTTASSNIHIAVKSRGKTAGPDSFALSRGDVLKGVGMGKRKWKVQTGLEGSFSR
jgi:hypothetical protein